MTNNFIIGIYIYIYKDFGVTLEGDMLNTYSVFVMCILFFMSYSTSYCN